MERNGALPFLHSGRSELKGILLLLPSSVVVQLDFDFCGLSGNYYSQGSKEALIRNYNVHLIHSSQKVK